MQMQLLKINGEWVQVDKDLMLRVKLVDDYGFNFGRRWWCEIEDGKIQGYDVNNEKMRSWVCF